MVSFEDPDFTISLLREAKIGLWKIETEDKKPQRLYANEVVYKLLGVDGSKLTPEDFYNACFDRIEEKDKSNLRQSFRKMRSGNFTEAQFSFNYSPNTTLYFRAGGFKKSSTKKIINFEGAIRDITNVVLLQKKTERQEKEYVEKIRLATEMASSDALTGIKNRLAFERAEERMNEEIATSAISPFAIGVFDVNNLKKTNDKLGHEAGDILIIEASKLICTAFSHSPVFRIGGDEFAVILIGADYFDREKIISKFRKTIMRNKKNKKVVVSSGMADYIFGTDLSVGDVFDRADAKMYENKKKLKKKKFIKLD